MTVYYHSSLCTLSFMNDAFCGGRTEKGQVALFPLIFVSTKVVCSLLSRSFCGVDGACGVVL